MTTSLRGERGMSLPELILALLVFSVVMAGAMTFLRSQTRSFSLGNERLAMLQNARFALGSLEKDLRTAGAANPDEQPVVVYAGDSVVAFNGNYLTNVANDIFAVYYNPDAPAGGVVALTKAGRITIPNTSFGYPDTSYWMNMQKTVNSPSETIVFFVRADSSTTRTDDFSIYRQVNAEPRELLASNILRTSGVPFFRYYQLGANALGALSLLQVPPAALPLRHSVPVHLALSDTGTASRIDSLRGVQVSFTVTNGMTGSRERKRTVSRLVRLPNAGLRTKKICGDEPLLGGGMGFTAVYAPLAGGEDAIRLNWNPAQDETAGEQDVVVYVVWRRLAGALDWGEPYLNLPASGVANVYIDAAVVSGVSYQYALAAQDCTPQTSATIQTVAVPVP